MSEQEGKLVAQVMHHGIFDCRADTPVAEMARRMVEHDVSALVVTDEQGYLVGLISRTDLVALRAFEDYWPQMTAEHAMVQQVITVSPQAPMRQASRLIVVEAEGDRLRPVGVLSQTDIVRDMAVQA